VSKKVFFFKLTSFPQLENLLKGLYFENTLPGGGGLNVNEIGRKLKETRN
jgi:hypothetical protein